MTFEMWMGASAVMMPPVVPARPPWLTTLVCRLMRLTPSTITRCSSRSTWMTLPSAPLSLPAITLTVSPFLIFTLISEHLRRERNDLHEPLLAQLAAHGAEDARATGFPVGLEDHRCVLVEADVGTVGTTALLDGAHDHGLDDVALLDVAARDRVLDGGDDDVTDAGVTPTGAAEHTDAQDLLGTRVVGDLESRLLLDHLSCLLLRLLDDLHHAPALGRAERAGLHQEHTVADSTGVGLVVCLEPGGTTQHLAVERVLDAVLDRDHDGLVHLVADDQAFTDLAGRPVLNSVLAHAFSLAPGAVR